MTMCAGDLDTCPTADVRHHRGWAWHAERVVCRRCGRSSRWGVWVPSKGAHLCLPCDLEPWIYG